jgi:hypothetical protein
MQSQLDNTGTNQIWTSEEIKDLLMYVKEMNDINEELRAGIIAMQAKLNNEESKVRHLSLRLLQFEQRYN